MKKDNYLDLFDSKQKAIDHAMWLNFNISIELPKSNLEFSLVQIIIGQFAKKLLPKKWK